MDGGTQQTEVREMADGTGKKLHENGGRDLTPEGWEEMAAKLGEAAKKL